MDVDDRVAKTVGDVEKESDCNPWTACPVEALKPLGSGSSAFDEGAVDGDEDDARVVDFESDNEMFGSRRDMIVNWEIETKKTSVPEKEIAVRSPTEKELPAFYRNPRTNGRQSSRRQ